MSEHWADGPTQGELMLREAQRQHVRKCRALRIQSCAGLVVILVGCVWLGRAVYLWIFA